MNTHGLSHFVYCHDYVIFLQQCFESMNSRMRVNIIPVVEGQRRKFIEGADEREYHCYLVRALHGVEK